MSPGVWLGIGLLGGLGAVGRFAVDSGIARRVSSRLPVGTLAVNLSGTFALGVLAGATTDTDTLHLVATGLLGSYTTFSTWMFESERLAEEGEPGVASANLAVSLVVGVAIAWAGLKLGGLL